MGKSLSDRLLHVGAVLGLGGLPALPAEPPAEAAPAPTPICHIIDTKGEASNLEEKAGLTQLPDGSVAWREISLPHGAMVAAAASEHPDTPCIVKQSADVADPLHPAIAVSGEGITAELKALEGERGQIINISSGSFLPKNKIKSLVGEDVDLTLPADELSRKYGAKMEEGLKARPDLQESYEEFKALKAAAVHNIVTVSAGNSEHKGDGINLNNFVPGVHVVGASYDKAHPERLAEYSGVSSGDVQNGTVWGEAETIAGVPVVRLGDSPVRVAVHYKPAPAEIQEEAKQFLGKPLQTMALTPHQQETLVGQISDIVHHASGDAAALEKALEAYGDTHREAFQKLVTVETACRLSGSVKTPSDAGQEYQQELGCFRPEAYREKTYTVLPRDDDMVVKEQLRFEETSAGTVAFAKTAHLYDGTSFAAPRDASCLAEELALQENVNKMDSFTRQYQEPVWRDRVSKQCGAMKER